jgi:hypothetical protein
MTLTIDNKANGRTTVYTMAQIRREAQHLAKGVGRLLDYGVRVPEGIVGAIHVWAEVKGKDGIRILRAAL